ncbi:MAG TPA: ABC transporter substrate-binding protein [Candidatus Kapabacteria bacterium]|nr:ABC transporter substrate-binding protein [Candidatus Kapabacteria bacterium]
MRSTARLIALIPLLAMIAACGGGTDNRPQTAGQGGKKYGGEFTMNIVRGNPKGLDPVLINSKHADDIASQVFDRLIDVNDKLELVPELALALPDIDATGTLYTFHLRTDVSFQNDSCFPGAKGRRFVAEDVRYSLTRCCDPRTTSVAYWAFQDKVKGATRYHDQVLAMGTAAQEPAPIEGFTVLNDSTFQIELEKPYAPFLFYLINSLGNIVPHEAVEKYGRDFFRHPVGTGPFTFVSWTPDQDLILSRNPVYWGRDEKGNRLPFLDRLRFTFVKDDKIQFNEFLAGNLNECYGIPTESFARVFDANRKPQGEFAKYQVQAVPAMLTWYLDFNNRKPPFDNADLRRAFNYAIDREKLVKFVLQNSPYAPAVHGLVPPVFPGYPVDSVKGYSYNPDEAKRLLAKAGYPEGKGLPPVTLYIYPEPRLNQVAQAVQEMVRTALNVDMKIQIVDFPQLIDQAEGGKLAFWGTRWYGDYPDPETYLLLLFGELVPKQEGLPSYPNSSRYNNPAFNEEFTKGVATIDHVAQMKHYVAAEQIAMADAPLIPLFYEMHYRLLQSDVRDYPLNGMARPDMKYVWLDR